MYTLELLVCNPAATPFYTEGKRSNENAGVDLYVAEPTTFSAGAKKIVGMGVRARLVRTSDGEAVHFWMAPRSSISKTGLMLCNSIGVIDRSYRGELMAFLWNTKEQDDVVVQKGDRVVQIVAPEMGHISQVRLVDALDETERGEGGFGSTGR